VLSTVNLPILQFGTSRFLQAHVDLFVSEALVQGRALGGVCVVQSTDNPTRAARTAALAASGGYPVHLRGVRGGQLVNEVRQCTAVQRALRARVDWIDLQRLVVEEVQVIISNTADMGYELDPRDDARSLNPLGSAPHSFPAKLLVLLHRRWQQRPDAGLTVLPCELLSRNGDTLRDLVVQLSVQWRLAPGFSHWLRRHLVWANSLVDRIVPEAIEPAGAVAEPYALWAIERQPGLQLPCEHPDIVLTDDLGLYERLKLFLLNAGHSWLAECWQRGDRDVDMTVLQAMQTPELRDSLEALWAEEILPVFEALGQVQAAEVYLVDLRERLLNPYLAHRLADIAQNHAQKKQRRMAPIIALARASGLDLPQLRLKAALAAQTGQPDAV